MNIKMTTNSQLSTTESKKQTQKNKVSKQLEEEQIREMEIIWRVFSREEERENGGKGTGSKKHKWQVQNRKGGVKNSTGNGEAKELIYMTHGRELREGLLEGSGYWAERGKGEKLGQL